MRETIKNWILFPLRKIEWLFAKRWFNRKAKARIPETTGKCSKTG